MSRVLIVGDVHGCAQELDRLVRESGITHDDRVVFVGDLLGKGPDWHGVVMRARALGAVSVRGNHDEHWLEVHTAGEEASRAKPEERQQLERMTTEDWGFLAACPYYLVLEEYDTVVVHAGIVPGVPLEAQNPYDLMNMRTLRHDGTASARREEGVAWASTYGGPSRVVFGHDALSGLQRHPFATGIDTGCVYGGRLTGYVLPDHRIVSVDAVRAWSPIRRHAG